jgi:hypothetical protein
MDERRVMSATNDSWKSLPGEQSSKKMRHRDPAFHATFTNADAAG